MWKKGEEYINSLFYEGRAFTQTNILFNFSSRFLNPNYFFQFKLQLFQYIRSEKPPGTSLTSILFQKVANSRPFSLNFKSFSHHKNNFGSKIPVYRAKRYIVCNFYPECIKRSPICLFGYQPSTFARFYTIYLIMQSVIFFQV